MKFLMCCDVCALAACAASMLVGGGVQAGPIEVPGWELVWQDEFDQASPDTSEWELFNLQNSFNNELQYYRPEQITTNNGNLVITATDVPIANKQYRSGRMESWQEWGYGRFEARIDLPTTQGMWPAFWLLPETDTTPWPSGGEIDILENRGSQPHLVSSAYHFGPDFNGHDYRFDEYTATDNQGNPVNFHEGFHDYAVEWEPGVMRFFVDGVNYHTLTSAQVPVYDTPKKIVLNLAVGGFFGGDPDGSTVFPQEMLVDYVRVWQRPDEPSDDGNLLNNPGFDDNGGSLTNWIDYGNAINNVSSNSEISEGGSSAVKIYGQFNDQPNLSGVAQSVVVTEGASLHAEASAHTPSWDTLAGKDNQVFLTVQFYSTLGAAPGSASFISEETVLMLDGNSPEDTWLQSVIDTIVPEGAVEARMAISLLQLNNDNGAVWIDSAGLFLASLLSGDFNGSGQVEQGDLDLVLQNWGVDTGTAGVPSGWTHGLPDGQIEQTELDAVLSNWGATSAPDFGGSSVPEPALAGVIVTACLGCQRVRRARA